MVNDYNGQLLNPQPDAAAGPARMGLTRRDPKMDVILSKLVANNNTVNGTPTADAMKRGQINGPDLTLLDRISDKTASDVIDIDSIMQMTPEIETAKEILVSSILSPKDLSDGQLMYSVEPGSIPPQLAVPLVEAIRDHFENSYKMSEKCPDILRETLFTKGSYPLLVLPESSIDQAINGNSRLTTESLKTLFGNNGGLPKQLGILGNPTKVDEGAEPSLESLFGHSATQANYNPSVPKISFNYDFVEEPRDKEPVNREKLSKQSVKLTIDPRLTVVDNPDILRLPDLIEKVRRDRVSDALRPASLASEAFSGVDPNLGKRGVTLSASDALKREAKERGSMYRSRQFRPSQTISIAKPSALSRESVGHPLTLLLPVESVIPVHVPSSPKQHLGYFILCDRQGNPLVKTAEADYFNEMNNNLKMNRDFNSQLVTASKRAADGVDWYSRQLDIDEMDRIYSDLVEVELTQRLNGFYGGGVKVARPQEVYRIMLARALANMHTQLLYVPAELMTYFAFDYNQYGVGESLLSKNKMIASLRTTLMVADMIGAIKNSVGNTIVNITLDPEDPDPTSTVEHIMHEFAYGRSGAMLPLGATNPRDIVNSMFLASVQYVVSGNPRYPTTTISAEDKQNNRVRPDKELTDNLLKRLLLGIGVPPESVDAAQGPEFARSVTESSLIFSKRVLMFQRVLVGFLQDFIVRYTLNSGTLMDRLREIVRNSKIDVSGRSGEDSSDDLNERTVDSHVQRNGKVEDPIDAVIVDFIYALRVSLPKPDQGTSKAQIESFKAYSDALTDALAAYIDGAFLTELELADDAENRDAIIANLKAYFLREYLRENNMFTELETLGQVEPPEGDLTVANKMSTHVDLLRKVMGSYLIKVVADRKAVNAKINAAKEAAGVSGGGNYSPEPTAPQSSGGDIGTTGGDDFGGSGDGDVTLDIDTTTTTTTTGEEEEPADDEADDNATPDGTEPPAT